MKRPWFIHLLLLLAFAGSAGARIWILPRCPDDLDAWTKRQLAAAHPIPDWCAYQLYDWRDPLNAYRCSVGSLRMLAAEHSDLEIEWLAKEWGR